MSVGKLTLLSADWEGSGAVVGSSVMVADSSGAEAGGWVGFVAGAARVAGASALGVAAAPLACTAAGRLACSAARNVTKAAPKNSTVPNTMSQIARLFCITHHSESDCCTCTLRAVSGRQPQVRRNSGLPIGAAYDVAGAIIRTQRVGDWRGIHKRKVIIPNPLGHIAGQIVQSQGTGLELSNRRDDGVVVSITG